MTLTDLLFLASVIFVLVLIVRIALAAILRRWAPVRRLSRLLGLFLAVYGVTLIAVSLLRPRRFYASGERRCFDDWCVTSMGAEPADGALGEPCPSDEAGRTWIAETEVSSVARGIRQRARDARAELEDRHGRVYQPCHPPIAVAGEPARELSDQLGPGESFRVFLPFRLPAGEIPAGLILHHGDIPGIVGIGADQSLFHRQALHRLDVKPGR